MGINWNSELTVLFSISGMLHVKAYKCMNVAHKLLGIHTENDEIAI